jgi:hypothetical protein
MKNDSQMNNLHSVPLDIKLSAAETEINRLRRRVYLNEMSANQKIFQNKDFRILNPHLLEYKGYYLLRDNNFLYFPTAQKYKKLKIVIAKNNKIFLDKSSCFFNEALKLNLEAEDGQLTISSELKFNSVYFKFQSPTPYTGFFVNYVEFENVR